MPELTSSSLPSHQRFPSLPVPFFLSVCPFPSSFVFLASLELFPYKLRVWFPYISARFA
jgi:hypothetical protein